MNEVSEQAREAAESAREKLREQLGQRSTQAGDSVSGTARDLRCVGEELRKQGQDRPAKFADRAADQTERLGSYLKESDVDQVLSDVEDFGRRQPLAVLAGGLVLGVAAARFLKASSRDRYRKRVAPDAHTRELGVPTTPEPRGVYAEPAVSSPAAESRRQAPVPAGGTAGR